MKLRRGRSNEPNRGRDVEVIKVHLDRSNITDMCVVKYERLVLRRKLALRHFRLMGKCSALVRELHDVVEVLRINLLFKWN